jgi:DNA mismatch repair protein MSH2
MAVAFMNDLLQKNFRLEIWVMESRKGGNWKIEKVASPGNLTQLDDLLFSNADRAILPVIVALKVSVKNEQKNVGVAYTNASSYRTLGIAEFIDNDIFTNLESLLIQLSVKECILQDDAQSNEIQTIKAMLNRCDIIVTETKKSDFSLDSFEQDMNRLLADELSIVQKMEFDKKLAMACCSALISYLALLSDESNFNQYSLVCHDLTQFMRLDMSAVKALHLMPSPQDGSNKTMSLYGLLNKCKTSQGSRLLAQWIKQPLMDLHQIEIRLNLTEEFVENPCIRQEILVFKPFFNNAGKFEALSGFA